ncbi:MAG: hypothetical protein DSY82_08670 [Flavobacteriia bacterium]|nr:MAG: hypothetical protein DSY82_08670 [Flavobacteriia bacterium]
MVSIKELRYPLFFGVLGAFLGLWLRYFFTGGQLPVSFKFMLHAHSHLMMLGFIFNALLLLVWQNFTSGFDLLSKRYFIALQIFVLLMMIAFLYQGYGFYSILFSTFHLWTSYILLIRLWKRLEGNRKLLFMIKAGIIFHFLSSLGPYALGPLSVMGLKASPWYQQAVFFYLHFQFFGIYFVWLQALFFKKTNIIPELKFIKIIVVSLALLYVHSLDFSFDHPALNFIGGLTSTLLFVVYITFYNRFKEQSFQYRFFYFILLTVFALNILGSFPYFSDLVVQHRMILIAWLHFLFLGVFAPFIWMMRSIRLNGKYFIFYAIFFILTEFLLIYASFYTGIFGISVMKVLFYTYLGVFIGFLTIHSVIYLRFRKPLLKA